MKYVLLIYLEENALNDTEREQCYADSAQLAQQLNSNGQYLATAPLHPVATATSVRVREGKSFVTDGPFAETREQLGGFFLIEAADLDEAIAIAAQIPGAKVGTVEIRPVIEVVGLPA
ncbi:YciI family protein [Leptolyngbya sp. NIES-2104]|uniref:YciI family protein n=1 Tax=Leptolyngbya sp. NIES-2104 TaxID=1552121 RepID=UPI0006EC6887|nr:YciI family protein [Leptolyngbya sp. NIES-2104]GAP99650.1 hypothetical protein YeeN [Leptolyngbya sp. NIES-2104]